MQSLSNLLSKISLLSASVALFAITSQVHSAEAHGEATISNLRYTLTDLAPNDGIAPNISWSQWGWINGNDHVFADAGRVSPPLFGSWENGPNATSASVAGGSRFEDTVLKISHTSESLVTNAFAMTTIWFDLAPGTSVRFHADYALSTYDADPEDWALSRITFLGDLVGPGDFYQDFQVGAWSHNSQQLNGTTTLYYDNMQATPVRGALSLWVTGYSRGSAVPVPEPSTYAMLAAGLALIGVGARQQARRT